MAIVLDINNLTQFRQLLAYTGGGVNEKGINNIIMAKVLTVITEMATKQAKQLIDLLDLNKNFGQDLDNYGRNYGLSREGRNDLEFQNWIRNYSGSFSKTSDRNSVLQVLSGALGIELTDFEMYEKSFSPITPANILELDIKVPVDRVSEKVETVRNISVASGNAFSFVNRQKATSKIYNHNIPRNFTYYKI